MVRFLVGIAALVVAVPTHAAAFLVTFFGSCGISDTADVVPAPASLQGRVCHMDSWLNVPMLLLGSSVVLAVVLATVLWSTPKRWVGLTAPLWLALVSALVLTLPPDGCLTFQEDHPRRSDCSRVGNGS